MSSQNRSLWVLAAVLFEGIFFVLSYNDDEGRLQKLVAAFISGPKEAEAAVDQQNTASPVAASITQAGFTSKEYRKNACQWLESVLVSDYEKYGKRSAVWDEKAKAFFNLYAQFKHGENGKEVLKDLKQAGDELLGLGCTDPYILYMQGNILYQRNDFKTSLPMVEQSRAGLNPSRYPWINRYYGARRLQHLYEKMSMSKKEIGKLSRRRMEYLGRASSDPAFAGHQRYYLEVVLEEWAEDSTPDYTELLMQEMEKKSGVDPWIQLMVKGLCHTSAAWKARGGEWAYLVTEQGQEEFKKELELSRTCFTEAHALHPEFPEAATEMIAVCMAISDGKEERQWFDRAVAAQFDYIPAYTKYFWALRPRWGGSHEQMLQFGTECLNTKRFDTDVPRQFLKALRDIGSELGDWKDAYRKPGIYAQLQILCAGMLAEPQQAARGNYWKTVQALTAWAAGECQDAKKLFDALGENIQTQVFAEFKSQPEFVRGEVNLRTGQLKDIFLQAEKLYEKQAIEALPYYEELRDQVRSDQNAVFVLDDRIAVVNMTSKIFKGDWVDLLADGRLLGWEKLEGDWEVEADGGLKASTRPEDKRVLLVSKFSVAGNYEIRGEVEAEARAGVLMGYVRKTTPEYVVFSIDSKRQQATLCEGFGAKHALKQTISALDSNQFYLQVVNGLISAQVNGSQVFTHQKLDRKGYSPHGGMIGLGESFARREGIIKYRHLQLRRTGGQFEEKVSNK